MKRTFINKVILSPADRNCSGSQPCKKRDPETLRAARRLRMTGTMSSRSVSTPVIPQCLYAGYRSFLLRPILRIETLRNDEAAGVRGFTLVELLVVVLIIGVLSAIAIPMYQGAVDKSHWSTMLPASKAIKDAEEAFKMTNGEYSDTMEHLDVQMNNSDLTFDLQTPNNLSQPNVIKVTNSKLGDRVRLASYLDDSPMFAGQLHCEALKTDERANKLCDKLLNGEELPEFGEYKSYLLDQSIDQTTCKDASGSWSTSKTTCYNTTAERCEANGLTYADGKCSATNKQNVVLEEGTCLANKGEGCNYAEINEGGVCQVSGTGSAGGCQHSIINSGGDCKGSWSDRACFYAKIYNGGTCSGSCENSEVYEGGICQGGCKNSTIYNGGVCKSSCWNCCEGITVKSGGKCIATESGTCDRFVTYEGTGCCEGNYCGNAPKC